MWEKMKKFFSQFSPNNTLTWQEEQYLNSAQNCVDLEQRQQRVQYRRQREVFYFGRKA